ncbi:hypothetical protein PVK06_002271 [Gossypium arboreum]|uniref:Uncharacterized protein n=1 Tax=Gossypium arboreum TaxID=29729 RepID=A0ABR0R3E4_GOSAR|nr:hypothetical protein PVK06_002271 [Gossypium arboreum]
MGSVSLSIFTSSSEPPIYIPIHNETPYEDLAIRVVIPDEFFQNLNIWHVKVPLVNYTTIEMHQKDGVLWQFRFRQSIPVIPKVLNDEYKIDLRDRYSSLNISKFGKIGMVIYYSQIDHRSRVSVYAGLDATI